MPKIAIIWLLTILCTLLNLACGSLVQDVDKCTLWLKTDGSSCQPSTFFSWHKFILGTVPQVIGRQVCCTDGTGCFSIEKDTPWECYHELPQCMDEVKPHFLFYTPERRQEVQLIDYFNLNSSCQQLNVSESIRPFFVIVHGFGKDWPKSWMFNLKDKLVDLGNNVMIVRWTGGSIEPWYFQSSSNTRTVGAAIANVMKCLRSEGKISFGNSTVIGFSLGGQISGYVGDRLPKLKRIIGIDPAGPMFQCMHPKARLDGTDAQFVQAIHTHGDYFLMTGCGTLQQLGTMDVYVNGGVQQAGCNRGTPQAVLDLTRLNFSIMVEDASCSHNRVPPLLIEMVNNAKNPDTDCQFIAFPCTSSAEWLAGACFECPSNGCPRVGYLTDLGMGRSGRFYVNTLGENVTTGQYCGRQFLVSLTSDSTLKGRIMLTFKGSGMQYLPVMFQDLYDVMNARVEKKIVAVVPWNMTQIDSLDVSYRRNRLLLTGGPKSWKLGPVYVKSVEGVRQEFNGKVTVTDMKTTTVDLSRSSDTATNDQDTQSSDTAEEQELK